LRSFFDTSVLIPTFFEDHEHHTASLRVFLRADKKQAGCGAHSLVEFYATTTRLPGRHRLSGEQVLLFLENIRERITIVRLDDKEYYAVLRLAAEEGIAGGAVYDLVLASCALKARAEIIYTWNVRHFRRFGSEIARRIRTP
jgi:predicted nucleic acid-binding protein